MGIFSNTSRYLVDSASMRVVKDDMISDGAQQAAIRAVLGNRSIAEEMGEAYRNAAGRKVEKMVDQARKKYPDGIMRSSVESNHGQGLLIRQAIEQDIGQTVSMAYALLAPINYIHLTWQHLVEDYGYDRETNTIQALAQGGTAYLKTFLVLLPPDEFQRALDTQGTTSFGDSPEHGFTPDRLAQDGALRKWVKNPPAVTEDDRSNILVKVTYVLEQAGATTEKTLEFVLDPENGSDMEWYQAMYFTPDGGTGYWSYQYGSGRHPALDNRFSTAQGEVGEFMPVVYFRLNHENLADESLAESTDYQGAKKLLDTIGMDYAGMSESIHENPDIDAVRNAYLMFGVSPDNTHPAVTRYLFNFFSDFYDRSENNSPRQDNYPERDSQIVRSAMTLQPATPLGEHRMGAHMTFFANGLSRRYKTGRVTDVGEVVVSRDETYEERTYIKTHISANPNQEPTRTEVTEQIRRKVLVLQYQVTDSVYQEIQCLTPVLRHHIDGSGRGTNNRLDDDDLLVPVDMRLVAGWTLEDREALYLRAMHLVFNVRDVQKVKWYERELFQFILTAAAIIITFYFQVPAIYAFATTMATASVTALVWSVAITVVKSLAITQGFKMVAEELGPEFALLAAALVAIYTGYQTFQAGSVTNAPWASELLQASNNLAQAASNEYQRMALEYQSDLQEFNLMADEAFKELEEVNKLLDHDGLLDPMALIGMQPATLLGESPQNFYLRTIHSGNIGVSAIDAVHRYVDVSLKLPDFTDTYGGFHS